MSNLNVRRFSISNSVGHTIDLNSKDDVLFINPSGLGFTDEINYYRIGRQFLPLNDDYAQGEITGTLMFAPPNSYTKYYNFMRFAAHAPLTLSYTIEGVTYYRQVKLHSIEKTEKGIQQYLPCQVTFRCLTLFYRPVEEYVAGGGTEDDGKEYDYHYDYTYSGRISQTVTITSDTTVDSPCKIFIYGPAVNPMWSHLLNNRTIETGKYNGTIPEGHYLVINSTDVPYSINEYDENNELVSDRYAGCDFSTERFFFLKLGTNRISISHEGSEQVALKVDARLEYESV